MQEVNLDEVFSNRSTEFEDEAERELERIRKVDSLVNQLLDELKKQNKTKRNLADALDLNPAFVRRFFSQKGGNPTINTLLAISSELGFDLQLVRSK